MSKSTEVTDDAAAEMFFFSGQTWATSAASNGSESKELPHLWGLWRCFFFNTFDSFSFLAQIHSLLEHQPVRTPAHNLAFCSPHVLLRPPLVFLQPVCLYAAQNLCFLRLSTCSNIFDPLPWAVMWDLMNLRILTGSLGQLSYCAFSCLLP